MVAGSDAQLSFFERKLRQAQREAEREEEEIRKEQEHQMAELMQVRGLMACVPSEDEC